MRHVSLTLTIIVAIFGSMMAKAAPIVGGQVDVIVHSANQFIPAGIGIGLIPPVIFGAPPPSPVVLFPIIGGDDATGILELDGGVTFTDGVVTLQVTNFVIDFFALTTTVDTLIIGGPFDGLAESVLRSDNFNCFGSVEPCFDTDGITIINDPAFSGSFFSQQAMDKFEMAFPGNTIDFGAMNADVATVTSLVVIPLPNMAIMFGLSALVVVHRRRGLALILSTLRLIDKF